MKRALKILGITLASIIGVVIVAIALACYVVFTPKRLTPIVNQVADSLLACQHELDEVNLTFFRTFPDFGLSVKGLYIINPMEGAQSDTVLAIPELVVGVDLAKAIDGCIDIKKFHLEDVEANIYIDSEGKSNVDILNLSQDTVEDNDTTEGGWVLREIELNENRFIIEADKLTYLNVRDSMDANVQDMGIEICYEEQREMLTLNVDANDVDFTMKDETLVEDVKLHISLPLGVRENGLIVVDDGQLAVNEFQINLDGGVTFPYCMSTLYMNPDLHISTNDWQVSSLLALLPESYQSLVPKEVIADGKIQLNADVTGVFYPGASEEDVQEMGLEEDSCDFDPRQTILPIVDAQILIKEGKGKYTALPYYFDAIDADIVAHVDLEQIEATTATINRLYAKTGKTNITVTGNATEIFKSGKGFALDNPFCDLKANMSVYLPDADYWIQNDSSESWVKGVLNGQIGVQTHLSDVTHFNLNNMKVKGDLAIQDLDLMYCDSTLAHADQLTIQLSAPKTGIRDKAILSANCIIDIDEVNAQLLASNLNAHVDGGKLNAAIEIDIKDTTQLPTLTAGFDFTELNATLDTITAHAINPKGQLTLTSSRRNKSTPRMVVHFSSDAMEASMGKDLAVDTRQISIDATATYNKNGDNVLLKWNPRIRFDLQNAHADIAQLGTMVSIPEIKFAYSNRDFVIDTSRIVIGKSDFSLGGEVKGLGKWMRKESNLTGILRFTSEYSDVNELLDIVSRLGSDTTQTATSEQITAAEDTIEKDPFMVPERVDLTLVTHIKSADVFNEHLKNLGGNVYIKDGTIIIEEMGFICEAAKLQLTAMYRTPRRDHIYVGLDYHMVDIDLQQLISMIPQLDTLMPMLSAFRGGAQFHVAAETYVNSQYQLKPSTLRGACAIEGKDLVVLDGETFNKISKILLFSPKTENKIDTLTCQVSLYKDEIKIYPFCLGIDNYMAALGGNHFLDMSFDYHVSLLRPFYLGVDINGTFDDLNVKPAKCRYAQDFRPLFHKDVETKAMEIRNLVNSSLKKNVKIN